MKFSLHAVRILYHSIYSLKQHMYMYLYAGTGNPCAGHSRVRSSSRMRSYPANFASLENFGFFVATGSNRERNKILLACYDNRLLLYLEALEYLRMYLYVGTGNPCAGHNKVRLSPRTRSYQASFDSLENFGFFVAIGSNYIEKHETIIA